MTTLYVDNDYLIDQVFWQYATVLSDRLDTQRFLDARTPDPARVIRLGEEKVGLLMPWLDELAILSTNGHRRDLDGPTQASPCTCRNASSGTNPSRPPAATSTQIPGTSPPPPHAPTRSSTDTKPPSAGAPQRPTERRHLGDENAADRSPKRAPGPG